MASVLFLALFFCVISSICYCIMRHNRNNNALKSRNRLTHVGQRLRPEADEKKLFRYDEYDELEMPPIQYEQDMKYPYPYGYDHDGYNGEQGGFENEGGFEGSTAFGMDPLEPFGGEDIYSPSTDISAISSEHGNRSEQTADTNQSRFYSFGPILQAMIDEWRLGEEILSKEKSRK
eukprot:Em0009g367a